MRPLATQEHSGIHEMMTRLGIEPGGGVLPALSLRYATAFRRCDSCVAKKACQKWLDHRPADLSLAPRFCVNADILFELQCDEPGPRAAGGSRWTRVKSAL